MPSCFSKIVHHASLPVVLAALTLPLSLTNCKPPVKELPEDPPQATESVEATPTVDRLPVNRTIRDINGRELKVRIIGRANTIVRMTRLDDNYKFDFPVAQLSQEDRRFVLQFPESVLSPITQDTPEPAKKDSGEAPYIKTRKEEIERIIKEIQELTAELRAIEPGTSRARTQQKKIDAKEMEIVHLESQMEIYRKNH